MKYSYSLCASVAAALLAFSPLHAHAIDLGEAIARTYENNPNLFAERANLRASDELLPQAYSGFLPTITVDYNRGKEDEDFKNGQEQDNITDVRQISISQPVFRGFGTLSQIGRAHDAIDAARSGLIEVEQNILGQAVDAYMASVRNQEVLKLSQNNEQVLKEQLEATKERFALGENTRTDVAQAEARLSRAISDRIRAEGDLIAAKAAYERVIGEPVGEVAMPTAAKMPAVPETLDVVIGRALEGNPSLQRAKSVHKVAERDVDISKSVSLPTASVVGTHRREEGLGDFFVSDERETNSVTLNVTVPLYQSGAEYSRVRQSKQTAERRMQEFEEIRNATVESATNAWKDVETARATIVSTEDAVRAAKVALEGVRQEADVGSRTTLDVLDAEQELFVAQVNLVSARRNEVIALYNLKAVMGELTVAALGLDVDFYNPEEYHDRVRFKPIGF